jgi:molybdenum cofactor cytidylyltransferase
VAAPLVGILLAGGSGTRFRASGGGDKLMHPLPDGTPIAVAALRNLIAAVPQVVAVVRPGADELATALRDAGAEVTVCPEASEGMGTTLAHAVRHAGEAGGYVVALGDMPSIRPETIARVAACVQDGAVIAAPVFKGERGHPVGFAGTLCGRLQALQGDAGAREVLKERKADVQGLDVDDPFVLRDVDTVRDVVSHR